MAASLLLPLSIWLLLIAAGIAQSEAFSESYGRWTALTLGLIAGAFGLLTAPIGLGPLLNFFRLPKFISRSAVFLLASTWVAVPALVGLSAYAAWVLLAADPPSFSRQGLNSIIAAFFLLAAAALRVWLEGRIVLRRIHFGRVSYFEPDVIECEPGGEASGLLKLSKQAARVEAGLELYGDGDGPIKILPARVGEASPDEDGWAYRVTCTVPADAKNAEEGGWQLSIKAYGASGGLFEDSASIELPPKDGF
jgi:hypothetical protein